MGKQQREQAFALCMENRDCEDLEKRKIYQVLPDEKARKEGYLRVIDESGEVGFSVRREEDLQNLVNLFKGCKVS